MDDMDFSDVPNPVVDLSVSGILGDDDQDNTKYYTDDISSDEKDEKHTELSAKGDDNENYDDNDEPYDSQSLSAVIADLQQICDREGIACTAPMESLIKSRFSNETLYVSSLEWFVRGIIVANQTQIIPTVMSTISELKIENRTLQQSSNKLNRESDKISKLSSDIIRELTSIKEDMKDSFRESIKVFLKEAQAGQHVTSVANAVDKTKPMSSRVGEITTVEAKNTQIIPDQAPVEKINMGASTSKKDTFIAEKKAILRKVGFSPAWFSDVGESIMDMVYDDDLHGMVKSMKLTPAVKSQIREAVNDNLEKLLDD